jgi:hypothetical protein
MKVSPGKQLLFFSSGGGNLKSIWRAPHQSQQDNRHLINIGPTPLITRRPCREGARARAPRDYKLTPGVFCVRCICIILSLCVVSVEMQKRRRALFKRPCFRSRERLGCWSVAGNGIWKRVRSSASCPRAQTRFAPLLLPPFIGADKNFIWRPAEYFWIEIAC